jgi:hypothetical protein
MTIPAEPQSRGRFRKGRAKTGGRRRGTPNRATRAVKEFLAEVLDCPAVQDAIEQRILNGDTTAFFKALEMVHGKPRQAVELAQDGPTELVVRWQSD